LFIQSIKGNKRLKGYKTLAVLLIASIVASAIYTTLSYAGLWETVSQVLITAGAFYAFVISRFEK